MIGIGVQMGGPEQEDALIKKMLVKAMNTAERLGDLRAGQSRLRRLCRQQGRRAGDVARDGIRAVAARHPGQCRITRWHHHTDLESRSADTGGGRSFGKSHFASRSARTLRQTGRGRKDRAVPRFRRCFERPGRGDFRRWRRDGFPCRRADLSRIELRSTKII